MFKRTLTSTLLLLGVWTCAAAAVPPELEQLSFLLGGWISPGNGQPGEPSGKTEFSLGLQDHVILRNNSADYPATADRPASHHEDLMVIYALPGDSVRADYYDSEGHAIRYVVQVSKAGNAVFLSAPAGGQPRFRLSYTLDASGALKGTFEIAPPGAPDAFKPYLSWESRRPTTSP